MRAFRLTRGALRIVFAALLIVAFSATAEAEGLLGPGDVLSLSLPGEEGVTGAFPLDDQSRVILPEIGHVNLLGLSIEQAKTKLSEALSKVYRNTESFDATLKEHRKLVTVLGYVRQPGTVDLSGDAGVQEAVTAAGGLVPGAQLDRMQLRRDGRNETFNFKKYLDTGDTTLIPALRTMDTVFVPASPLTGNVQVEFDARTLTEGGDAAENKTGVKIFGEVRSPGAYGYADGQSVVDLIMRAGGVTRYAAVEQIRVITNGEPQPFNLKLYLDTGDTSTIPSVGPGSTIFVPIETVGVKKGSRIVYVMGEVFKPGAFEVQDETSFLDVLANSGGPTRFADTKRVRILRKNGTAEPFDLAMYSEVGGSGVALPQLFPGDSIFVPEKLDLNEKSWLKVAPSRAVHVMGQVAKPGRFEWSDEMTFMDLLAHAGGPTPRADIGAIQIAMPSGDGTVRSVRFNLDEYLKNGGNVSDVPTIMAGYTIMVPELPWDPKDNKSQWMRQPAERSLYVFGAVKAPGRYAFDPSLNLLDILSAADGPTASADLHSIRINHRGEEKTRVSTVDLELYFRTGDEMLLPDVKPGDAVYVPERGREWIDKSKERTVRVLGSIGKPGRYVFSDEMTILDLLAEAGGPTGTALQDKILVVNLSCCRDQARTFDLIDFAKSGDVRKLPLVRPGDTVYVPDKSQDNWTRFTGFVKDAGQLLALFALAGVL
ncbi:SLBB domain-containing protein [Nisaea denitrificans]|uniref:SLBB domain-containing protein n=1 Tax=Nisaea denitrificans TaxID=390877 RepID=UPI0004087232|nr:SLBB domain-containing protein [Nisaea denitrificans]